MLDVAAVVATLDTALVSVDVVVEMSEGKHLLEKVVDKAEVRVEMLVGIAGFDKEVVVLRLRFHVGCMV